MTPSNPTSRQPILVLGGTGKTGRRIVDRLQARHWPVRIGSRSASPRFDWEDRGSWAPALAGIGAVYLSYFPDLAAPGAPEAIAAFVDLARTQGVRKLVLLSGRGEQEAQRCERIVQQSGLAWTIVRCGWFNQNFSENFLHAMVLGGAVALPASEVREPFIDAEDIADVAVAALSEAGHDGQLYELTGPELIRFPEAVATIARATGREIAYQPISREAFIDGLCPATTAPGPGRAAGCICSPPCSMGATPGWGMGCSAPWAAHPAPLPPTPRAWPPAASGTPEGPLSSRPSARHCFPLW